MITQETFIEKFNDLKNNYLDEIPDEEVRQGNYKVRNTWFCLVESYIELALGQGLLNGLKDSNEYIKYTQSKKFSKNRTSREEIVSGNDLIDCIIKRLGAMA